MMINKGDFVYTFSFPSSNGEKKYGIVMEIIEASTDPIVYARVLWAGYEGQTYIAASKLFVEDYVKDR